MWFEGAHFGRAISNMLDQCIGAGLWGRDGKLLSQTIIEAGAGDYVEIGTAFGASAITPRGTPPQRSLWKTPLYLACRT
jgi:hypothetical protein